MDADKPYKELQEDFFSNLSGTSIFEVGLLLAGIPPLSCLIRDLLKLLIAEQSVCSTFIMDFTCYVLPSLTAMTIFGDQLVLLTAVMLIMAILLLLRMWSMFTDKQKYEIGQISGDFFSKPYEQEQKHVTSMKSFITLLTCMAILAVDFQVFPRKFAKTETFGISLMDVGVGAFIISNAIVSPEGRCKTWNLSMNSKLNNLLKVVLGSSVVFILGLVRLASIKGTDYHEHVTEYGVHWNFFFTLFSVKIFAALICTIVPFNLSMFPPLVIMFCYEYALWNDGLMEYITGDTPRENLMDANREGFFSIFGYTSLYLFGIEIGKCLFCGKCRGRVITNLSTFACISAVSWLSFVFYEYPMSRRLTNLTYVLGGVASTTSSLLIFILYDIIVHIFISLKGKDGKQNSSKSTGKPSKSDFNLLTAINANGLAVFLLANVFTGVVNFSMETINASAATGFLILLAHSFLLTLVFSVLHLRGIRIKFW